MSAATDTPAHRKRAPTPLMQRSDSAARRLLRFDASGSDGRLLRATVKTKGCLR